MGNGLSMALQAAAPFNWTRNAISQQDARTVTKELTYEIRRSDFIEENPKTLAAESATENWCQTEAQSEWKRNFPKTARKKFIIMRVLSFKLSANSD